MKLYFLVEGVSSEMAAYPVWIKYILPMLDCYSKYDDFLKAGTGFYIVSGCGYPSIINHVGDASLNLIEIGNVNHFFIILDADEDDVETRESEIALKVSEYNLPEVTNVHIIVQNRCFETILLANRRVIPRNAETEPLMSYKRYYNVVEDNPEDMGPYDVQRFTHSQFHAEYAIKALREKRIRYSKANPSSISNSAYFQDIINRVGTTEHLKSFKVFIEKLNAIRLAIN
ncbi:hypothetical protein N5C36_02630 [Shewanella xiamenensis]|uniref:hypothetical protein n=1 Tax=Shewanella xiamenensis TaxID=332186 RepID=UPI001C4E14B1|nr:hypothetical protein [Shewanella xiamenensis]MBW0295221.1 hypothetical protein [Shewanella xiamenensis]MDH1312986.1 hypothetical protein [Shewanella xiamenensis]BDQ67435.1 hypothetical protein NUITMVS2_32470 [Shewanella xiamenensis]GLD79638.1 hypothetical protein NUITMVS3_40740 [Shewanella xiamenensis]